MRPHAFIFFFFNDTATTEIYTLSLHDALPISPSRRAATRSRIPPARRGCSAISMTVRTRRSVARRSEEHTSELQSQSNLVCRLLLEKKKKDRTTTQQQYNYDHPTPDVRGALRA